MVIQNGSISANSAGTSPPELEPGNTVTSAVANDRGRTPVSPSGKTYPRGSRTDDMEPNVGGLDRLVRTVAAAGLLVFGYRHRDTTPGTLAFVAGSDLIATAVIQRCPMNALFGIDTCPGA